MFYYIISMYHISNLETYFALFIFHDFRTVRYNMYQFKSATLKMATLKMATFEPTYNWRKLR